MTVGRFVLFGIFAALVGAAVWLFSPEAETSDKAKAGPRAVSVVSGLVQEQQFADIVQAIGTAKAQESVVLTSNVADTIVSVHFRDGQIVRKGELLVKLESAEEEAQFQEAEANHREAEKQYARIVDLVKSGNASTAALDASKRSLEEAKYRLAAEKARLSDRYIVAPFDGALGIRQVSEGTFLSTTTTISTLDAIDVINLDFYVPERFVATLAPGQRVTARVDAYKDRVFEGKVKIVDSRVDPITRQILVRAEVMNSDKALRPGMLMMVEAISRTWTAISVPEEAILPTGTKNYVFVAIGNEAERREVTLGIRRPGYVEVTSGLSIGDRVITQGAFRLGQVGQKIRDMGIESSQKTKAQGGEGKP